MKHLGPGDSALFAVHWPSLVAHFRGDRKEAHRVWVLADRKRLALPRVIASLPLDSPLQRAYLRQEWLLVGIADNRTTPARLLARYALDVQNDVLTVGFDFL